MSTQTAFQCWVANTIAELGGNPIVYADACNQPDQACFYSPSLTFMDGMPSIIDKDGGNRRFKALHSIQESRQSKSDVFTLRCELEQCAYPLGCGDSSR